MKKLLVAVLAVLLITSVLFVFSSCDKEELDPYAGYQVFDVMSFNIRMDAIIDLKDKDWSTSRAALVTDYLRKSDADIICLQEVCQSQYEDLDAALSDIYTIIYYQRESGVNPEGLAILYNKDFTLEESSRFWLSSTPEVESKDWGAANKRISVNAVLKHNETGLKLNVFTVHLDHISELSRENGLALILERASEYDSPALLMGDFNTDENSDCYALIASEMQDCRKAASVTDSGLTYQNYGYIKQNEDSLPIDFCFADKAFKVFEFEIKDEKAENGVYYSDHYAISSRIGLRLSGESAAENG